MRQRKSEVREEKKEIYYQRETYFSLVDDLWFLGSIFIRDSIENRPEEQQEKNKKIQDENDFKHCTFVVVIEKFKHIRKMSAKG